MSDDLRLTGDSFTCDVCGKPVQWRLDVDTCSVEEYGHRHNYAFACDEHLAALLRKRDFENNVEAYTGPEHGPRKPLTPEQMAATSGYLSTLKFSAAVMDNMALRLSLPKGAGATQFNWPRYGHLTVRLDE